MHKTTVRLGPQHAVYLPLIVMMRVFHAAHVTVRFQCKNTIKTTEGRDENKWVSTTCRKSEKIIRKKNISSVYPRLFSYSQNLFPQKPVFDALSSVYLLGKFSGTRPLPSQYHIFTNCEKGSVKIPRPTLVKSCALTPKVQNPYTHIPWHTKRGGWRSLKMPSLRGSGGGQTW